MRLHVLLGMVLLSLALIAGCESKPEKPAWLAKPEDVIGKWVVEATSVRDAAYNITRLAAERAGYRGVSDKNIEEQMGPIFHKLVDDPPEYIFKKGGKLTLRTNKISVDGTWTLEGNVLSITVEGSDEAVPIDVQDGLLSYVPEERRRRKIDLVRK